MPSGQKLSNFKLIVVASSANRDGVSSGLIA